jgi:hypothetical protein
MIPRGKDRALAGGGQSPEGRSTHFLLLVDILWRDATPRRRRIRLSGAIVAFTVAWQRPNDFRKVLSIVGSFTNLRGGHAYPNLIRKSDKKPIRIFLEDGRNDNRGARPDGSYDRTRDWFYQNVRMAQALTEKGYDVNYSWSIGKHGLKQGGVIIPEMMRWLWRDQPVSTDVKDTVERSFSGAISDKR